LELRRLGGDESVKRGLTAVAAGITALLSLFGLAAHAAEKVVDMPQPWQLGLQPSGSPTMDKITSFHDGLLVVITVITLFVLALLLIIIFRFRESKNPTPSTTTHNSLLEVLWTGIPILILVGIAIPSFKLLYFADHVEKADMTLKIIGNQWNWTYQYPDHGNFEFTSVILQGDDLKKAAEAEKAKPDGRPIVRQLSTDNPVVLPAGKKVRLLMTATDVIHAWAISSLGVRLDTVPGRLNETWVEIKKPGYYYGFCSELCGNGHAYMPIEVHAVTPAEFAKWVAAKQKAAGIEMPAKPVAAGVKEGGKKLEVARDSAAQ
jgi:cytochrome c oxidase subunit 2